MPGGWAIRNIGKNPNSQIVLIGKPRDWPEIQTDCEAPQTACPSGRTPIPPSVTHLASRGWAPRASADTPLCPPLSSSPRVTSHRTPAPPLTSRAHGRGRPSPLFPESSPKQSSAGPPLGPSLRHQLKTPTRRTPVSSCHRRCPAFASGRVRLNSAPLTRCLRRCPVSGRRL